MCARKNLPAMGWSIGGGILIALGTVVVPAPAAAQRQVGPAYPPRQPANVQPPPRNLQSGEDPFQLNPFTGRFEYVPIPYEFSPGTAGSPAYGFNWHSGRWDYVPMPPLNSPNLGLTRQITPGNYLDGRINPQAGVGSSGGGGASTTGEGEAQTAGATIPPSSVGPPIARPGAASPPPPKKPTTAPTTAPVTNPPPPPAMRVRLAGHWEFDYSTGRWVFVLPAD